MRTEDTGRIWQPISCSEYEREDEFDTTPKWPVGGFEAMLAVFPILGNQNEGKVVHEEGSLEKRLI